MYLELGVVFLTLFQIVIAERCVTPNNEKAECVPICSCKILLDALFKTEQIEFVYKSKCQGNESDYMVCCGSTSGFLAPTINNTANKDQLLPDRTYCGYQHSDDYFRNETFVGINEFPWLAGLMYNSENDNETNILCSGSLISNRYVLTSAHCTQGKGYELVGVRLGEYSIKTDEDCTEDSSFYECSNQPQNFDIEKIIPHPQYSELYSGYDICLLRLSKKVQYSDYIRPICLPTAGTMLAKPGDVLLASGWGELSFVRGITDTKKKILTRLIPNKICAEEQALYKDINRNHLCAREFQAYTGKSCAGASGGPLIFSFRNQLHQEGIASLLAECSGSLVVYTKVVNYLDWIKENIEP